MKLRIQGNSIRVRLNKSEVETFARDGMVEERVEFGNGEESVFRYSLKKEDVPAIAGLFEAGGITVFVPLEEAKRWVTTEQVGIKGSNGNLRLLVEKDFVCLTPRPNEDESDNFPHPLAG